MSSRRSSLIWAAAMTVWFVMHAQAEPPGVDPSAVPAEMTGGQRALELAVHVVDSNNKPVPNVRVAPWALRSSQGHDLWLLDDPSSEMGPRDTFTDADGNAAVLYPYYRNVAERIRTLAVSLHVHHPDFAFVDGLHVDVPLKGKEPHVITLTTGVPLEIRPLIDGDSPNLDDIYAMWSDGGSWKKDAKPEQPERGILRIPAMPPGGNSILLVKLDGDRATHFSQITEFQLVPGERNRIDVPLRPGIRVHGVLGGNVPRPILNGRVKAWTLPPKRAQARRANWFTWVPIEPDGTFKIDSWPADEPLQLIALCEGFIATSGKPPEAVENPPDPKNDVLNRPQVFPGDGLPIDLAMTPLSHCFATAVDEEGAPIAGVTVASWPNVHWWNNGSQIYCYPLVRCERLLRERDYRSVADEAFPQPFTQVTDANGKAPLELPVGVQTLTVSDDIYELPALEGRRDFRVAITHGETTEVVLHLQPRGTDRLGE